MHAHIAVFALCETTTMSLVNQLRSFFDARVSIVPYCLEQMTTLPAAAIDADLAVISSNAVLPLAAPYINPIVRTMVLHRSLSVAALDKLLSLPCGTKVVACHKYPAGAKEIATSIRELGFSHIICYSLYEDDHEICRQIGTAVVAGDHGDIPPWITRIIDIGPRDIELTSLVEIARLLDYPMGNSAVLTLRYTKEIVQRTEQLKRALRTNELLHNQIKVVLNSVADALIAIDDHGMIKVMNNEAEKIVDQKAIAAGTGKLLQVLPSLQNLLEPEPPYHLLPGKNLVHLAGKTYHVTISPVQDDAGAAIGAVIALRDVTEVIRLENEVRESLRSRGHIARYTFNDILGISPAIKSTINNARKLAASNLNIIIQGENGTGKELFAHAIHNASTRAKGPFVAANCAALPHSLMESELFGYEDGAFTGAKKGGKPGLIEQAHGGSIFLDEIGDISLEAQARLLRVIQEKEVARIGCTRIIPVDVRIIAATNKDLVQLVQKQRFRQDLYYRIFVAPLTVPPLRERPQDILYLAHQFLQDNHLPTAWLDPELLHALTTYHWPGNVRELQNIIQYAAVISDSAADFKRTVLDRLNIPSPPAQLPVTMRQQDLPLYRAILGVFHEAHCIGYTIGRGLLAQQLRRQGFSITEQTLRRRLDVLKNTGALKSGRGRQASQITLRGEQLLRLLNSTTYVVN